MLNDSVFKCKHTIAIWTVCKRTMAEQKAQLGYNYYLKGNVGREVVGTE